MSTITVTNNWTIKYANTYSSMDATGISTDNFRILSWNGNSTLYNTDNTDNTLTSNYNVNSYIWNPPKISPQEMIRKIIRERCFPFIKNSRKYLKSNIDIREMNARMTLRKVIGEDRYKRFLKNGFINIQGKSGKYYQIFPGHGITCVFEKGKMTERLCVILKGNFPPTDSLIMRYLLILNDENEFRKHAILHNIINGDCIQYNSEKNTEPLIDIYKKLAA